jgi:predicted dinucleotide-binding enzyme
MRIGIIGAGHIGGNIGQQAAARSGHEVLLSFARDAAKLESLAKDLGGSAGTPADADAKEYRLTEAQAVVEAVRSRRPIPPTPHYGS